jgi:predicted RecB family nuclease
MSLIQGMGRSRIEEQNKKGIFNLFQYSHTFRTRRLPKRIKNPAKPRYFALQARALRDKKVYIHGSPTLSSSSPAIYYDIEGIPGHRLYYLIGILTVAEASESYQYFWANTEAEEKAIFAKFLNSIAAYPNCTMFHFGNYERKAIKEMADRVESDYSSIVNRMLDSSYNVLSVPHHHCYFPTYSNRLKDIGTFFRLSIQINSPDED